MNAFITGSRAYGRPTPSSDVDLVIRADEATIAILRKFAEVDPDAKPGKNGVVTIRYGKLNIIVCEDDAEYTIWRMGTLQLRSSGTPSDKKQAKQIFDILRESIGRLDPGGSGR